MTVLKHEWSIHLQAWDKNLAYNAEFWADNCKYEYNEDRHDQSTEYDYVGQNIVATDETSVNLTILMGQWFKQRSSYNYYTGGCRDENGDEREDLEGCEGYSQVREYISLASVWYSLCLC